MAANRKKILWKPRSDSDGNLVILFPYKAGNVVIRDKDGNVIARGRSVGASNGYQDTVRFDRPGSSFRDVVVEDDSGRSFRIPEGSNRYENIGKGSGVSGDDSDSYDQSEPTQSTESSGGSSPDNSSSDTTRDPTSTEDTPDGSSDTTEDVPGTGQVPDPYLINPDIITTPDPISFPVIPVPDFNFTDPLDTAARVGEFNRKQSEQNFVKAIERSRELTREELAAVQEFAAGISDTQLRLLEKENSFNQQQRLGAAEVAIPGVQDIFARQRQRAETLASGRFLGSAEDRAAELAARNAAAEGSTIRGFGDESVVGRKTGDLLSAQQRLNVTQVGEGLLSRSLQQAAGLLFDLPTKANIAQRLPAQPTVGITQLAPALQSQENALTTFSPEAAQQSIVGQEEFQTNLNLDVSKFNAEGQYRAAEFNSNQQFQAILSRANIEIGNTQAINEAQRTQFNVDLSREEADRLDAILQREAQNIRNSAERRRILEDIGGIFGGIANIPPGVYDYIQRVTGVDLRPGTSTSPTTPSNTPEQPSGTPPANPPSNPDNSEPDREGRPPLEEPPPGQDTNEPDYGEDEDFGTDTGSQEEGVSDFEQGEGSGIPKVARFKIAKTLREAGLTKREVRIKMRAIERSISFNTNFFLPDESELGRDLKGVI